MKQQIINFTIFFLGTIYSPALADFGDADFPSGMFRDGAKSYHDAWCRRIMNECRVRFQGQGMWVEGQGGIQRNQFISYRYALDGGEFSREYYNYITYKSEDGSNKQALFLFTNSNAQSEFIRAFIRWRDLDPSPIPNYRMPASQGPQETHGRDKGLNPYDNPPITDWKQKTTE